ncbi:AAA family ATPase [[Clostridium] scindens]|nr:AAA family ATPase [[Clostridium] scindens]NSJ05228.1 AAA family ATPase [[Clostridium] scindens]
MNTLQKEGYIVMKIQAVLIDGFKNLSNVKIGFDNITALVALNNFGKSNVLAAIDFGLTFIKATMEDKADMMANSNLIPINGYMFGRNYKFQMEILTELDDIEYRVLYGYEFAWKCDESTEPYIVSEYLKIRPEDKGQKYTQLINREGQKALYKSSETGRCSSKINVELTELVVNKLRAYDEIFYIEIIKKMNSMRFYMENNLDAKSFYQPDPIIRKGLEDMAVDAESLPRVIYQLQQKNPDKFVLLKEVYKDLFPNVEDIIVKQYKYNGGDSDKLPADAPFIIANAIYVLFVKDKNLMHPIDFAMMSDGAKRVFMILARIILANEGNVSLIAIEEPENSVHPSLFQAYIQIISQLLDDCKIIITSHSPYVVSYLEPSWIHVGVNRQPGIAEFYTFKKSGQRLLQQDATDFKMSIGDYLFSMLADEESNWEDYLECDIHE